MGSLTFLNDADRVKKYNAWKDPIFILILLAGFGLRFYLASATTYLWDEDRDWIPIAESISLQPGHLFLPIHEFQHPSLPAYFIKAGSIVLGRNPIGFRLFPLIAGMLTLVIAFRLAQGWISPNVGRLTMALLAFNEYHIAASILATEKSFHLLFSMLAMYTFSRFLITEKPRYLYLAGAMTGLGFLCKYIPSLFLLVFFATLVFSEYRPWLRRAEPYIALLIFVVIISPDLYWNLMNNPTEGSQSANIADHMSRIGGLGFNGHYLLFYGRDAIRKVCRIIEWKFYDPAGEYPSMNPLFGIILLGGVLLTTFAFINLKHNNSGKRGAILRFLVLSFWMVFGFFTLVSPGTPDNLDPVVWFWVDITLLPAALLTGCYLSALKGKCRVFVWFAIGFAAIYATRGVIAFNLKIPSSSCEASPNVLWPATGQLVEVRANFTFCAICDTEPVIELVEIFYKTDDTKREKNLIDLETVNWSPKNRTLRLRADLDPGRKKRVYEVTFRVNKRYRGRKLMRFRVGVRQERHPLGWPPQPFWAG